MIRRSRFNLLPHYPEDTSLRREWLAHILADASELNKGWDGVWVIMEPNAYDGLMSHILMMHNILVMIKGVFKCTRAGESRWLGANFADAQGYSVLQQVRQERRPAIINKHYHNFPRSSLTIARTGTSIVVPIHNEETGGIYGVLGIDISNESIFHFCVN